MLRIDKYRGSERKIETHTHTHTRTVRKRAKARVSPLFKLQRCKLVEEESLRAKRKGSFFLCPLSLVLSPSPAHPRCAAPDTTCACVSRVFLFARSLILLAAPRAYADAAPRTSEDFSMVNCFPCGILPRSSAIEYLFQNGGLSRVIRSPVSTMLFPHPRSDVHCSS